MERWMDRQKKIDITLPTVIVGGLINWGIWKIGHNVPMKFQTREGY